jgi:hypothetical protein
MKGKLIVLLAAVVALCAVVGFAQATSTELEGPNGEHQVVVCKYVGTPGVDETLQTGQNPIVVDYHALLGAGFDGTFPFPFSDAQGKSVAVQWTADVHFSDIGVCPAPEGPPPTVEVCDPESGDIIEVPEDEADNYLPADDPACQEAPPPENVEVCDPESGDIIEVPADEADQYLPVDDPACEDGPNTTPHPHVKPPVIPPITQAPPASQPQPGGELPHTL